MTWRAVMFAREDASGALSVCLNRCRALQWNYWTPAAVLLPTVGYAQDAHGEFARPLSSLLHAGARGRLFTGRPLFLAPIRRAHGALDGPSIGATKL